MSRTPSPGLRCYGSFPHRTPSAVSHSSLLLSFPFPPSLSAPPSFPPPLPPRSSLLPITCLPSIPETPLLPLSAKRSHCPLTLLFSLPLRAEPQPFPVPPPLSLPRPRAHRTHLFRRVSAHQHSLSPSIRRGEAIAFASGHASAGASRKGRLSRRPRPPQDDGRSGRALSLRSKWVRAAANSRSSIASRIAAYGVATSPAAPAARAPSVREARSLGLRRRRACRHRRGLPPVLSPAVPRRSVRAKAGDRSRWRWYDHTHAHAATSALALTSRRPFPRPQENMRDDHSRPIRRRGREACHVAARTTKMPSPQRENGGSPAGDITGQS